jgi:hypothetical protein
MCQHNTLLLHQEIESVMEHRFFEHPVINDEAHHCYREKPGEEADPDSASRFPTATAPRRGATFPTSLCWWMTAAARTIRSS